MKHYTYKDVLKGLAFFILATLIFGYIDGLLEQWCYTDAYGVQ